MGICVYGEYGGHECMREGGWCWFFCVTERESERMGEGCEIEKHMREGWRE